MTATSLRGDAAGVLVFVQAGRDATVTGVSSTQANPQGGSHKTPWAVRFALPKHPLVDRPEVYPLIKKAVMGGGNPSIVAIYGVLGAGKTELAVRLVHDPAIKEHFIGGIFATKLGVDPLSRSQVLRHWCIATGMRENLPPDEMAAALDREVAEDPCLIVLDGVVNAEQVGELRFSSRPSCRVLITTNSENLAHQLTGSKALKIPELSLKAGAEMLGKLALQDMGLDKDEPPPTSLQKLAKKTGCLPLALFVVGSQLRERVKGGSLETLACLVKDYLDEKRLLKLYVAPPQVPLVPPLRPNGEHERAVLEAVPNDLWRVLEEARRCLPLEAQNALRALTVFPAKPNGFSIRHASRVSGVTEDVIEQLAHAGLIERTEGDRFCMHYAVWAAVQGSDIEIAPAMRFVGQMAEVIECASKSPSLHSALAPEVENIIAALRCGRQRRPEGFWRGPASQGFVRLVALSSHILEDLGYYVSEEFGESLKEAELSADEGLRQSQCLMVDVLLAKASVSEKRGEYAHALSLLHKAEKTAKCIQDDSRMLKVHTLRGVILCGQSYYEDAYNELAKANKLATRNAAEATDRQRCCIFQWMGEASKNLGDLDVAQELLHEALKIAQLLNDNAVLSGILLSLTFVELDREKLPASLKLADDGMSRALAMKSCERECGFRHARAIIWRMQAGKGSVQCTSERCLEELDEGLKLAEKIGHRWYKSALLCEKAELNFALREIAAAKDLFGQACNVARKIGSRDRRAFAHYGLARAYRQEGNTVKFLKHGKACIKLFESTNQRKWVTFVRKNLGLKIGRKGGLEIAVDIGVLRRAQEPRTTIRSPRRTPARISKVETDIIGSERAGGESNR